MGIKVITQDQYFGKVNGIHVDDMYNPYKRKEQLKYMKEENVDYVHSQDYDISYLIEVPSVKYLVLNEDVEKIETICSLPNLEGLLINSKYLKDIDFKKLPKLNKIVIGHSNKEIINVGNNVIEITIIGYDFSDLTKIMDSPLLEKLNISYGPKLKSLEGVEKFKNLKEITIDGCFRLHKISDLSNCKNLIKLNIYDCNKIEDLFPLISKLNNIEEINLFNLETEVINTIKDLSFLERLNKLKFLKTDYKILNKNSMYINKVIEIK